MSLCIKKHPTTVMVETFQNQRRVYRAVNSEGLYLHIDGRSFTKDEFYAWRGSRRQAEAIEAMHGDAIKVIKRPWID